MPRLTVTVSDALAEKLSRMSEHYGVTVSRLVSHSCDSVLQEGAPLSLGPVDSVSTKSALGAAEGSTPSSQVTQGTVTPQVKKPCKVDTETFRVPLGEACGQEIKTEDIDSRGFHRNCPGTWMPD